MKIIKHDKKRELFSVIKSRSINLIRGDGQLTARFESWDARCSVYDVVFTADELVSLAIKCADLVNSNNVNCPRKLRLVWGDQ